MQELRELSWKSECHLSTQEDLKRDFSTQPNALIKLIRIADLSKACWLTEKLIITLKQRPI